MASLLVLSGCHDKTESAPQNGDVRDAETPNTEITVCSEDVPCADGFVCVEGSCAEVAPVPVPTPTPTPNQTENNGGNSATGTETPDESMSPCNIVTQSFLADETSGLPTPNFSMDFETAEEMASKNATFLDGGAYEFVPGRSGNAIKLTQGILALPLSKVLAFPSGTITFWIALDETWPQNRDYFVWMDTDTAAPNWRLYLGRHPVNNYVQFYGETTSSGVRGNEVVWGNINDWAAGEWHHVAIAWNSAAIRWYMDGQLWRTIPRPGTFPSARTEARNVYLLSSKRYSSSPVNARGLFRMDSLRSYGEALSDNEIGALFRQNLDSAGFAIQSGRLRMDLLGAKDGYGLARITDAGHGQVKTIETPSRKLWKVYLRKDAAAGGPGIILNNTAFMKADLSCERQSGSGRTVLSWRNISLPNNEYAIADGQGGKIDVVMTLAPNATANEINSYINVINHSSIWSVEAVSQGIATGLGPIGSTPATTNLLLPGKNIGSSIINPFKTEFRTSLTVLSEENTYPSREVPMQWAALYDESSPTGGLYIISEDPNAAVKKFILTHSVPENSIGAVTKTGINIDVATYAEGIGRAGNSYSQQWPLVLGIGDGSWYEFARRYREFATRQIWASKGPLRSREDVPAWLADAGFFYPGASKEAIVNLIAAFQSRLNSLPAGNPLKMASAGSFILWHTNRGSYASSGFSEFAPGQANDSPSVVLMPHVQEGWADMQARGVAVAPYLLSAWWDAAYDSDAPNDPVKMWRRATPIGLSISQSVKKDQNNFCILREARYATRSGGAWHWEYPESPHLTECFAPDHYQSIADSRIPVFWHYLMCPKSTAWQDAVENSVRTLTEVYRATGVYMDVSTAATPQLCFAGNHQHPPGGGSFHTMGTRELLRRARNAARTYVPTAGLYGEGLSEPYMDVIDGFLIGGLWPSALPLAQAVYHDYTQFIGIETDLRGGSLEFVIAKQAQNFVWGGIPGNIHNKSLFDTDVKSSTARDYLINLALLRRLFKSYIVFGEMLSPPELLATSGELTGPMAELVGSHSGAPIPILNLQMMDPSATPVLTAQERFFTPAVLASKWRGSNGKVGTIVANVSTDTPYTISVPLEAQSLGYNPSRVRVYTLNAELGPFAYVAGSAIKLKLRPMETALVEME